MTSKICKKKEKIYKLFPLILLSVILGKKFFCKNQFFGHSLEKILLYILILTRKTSYVISFLETGTGGRFL